MRLAFDTHKAIKTLRDAGFDEPQAEAVVETVGGVVAGHVASKSDLQETEARLQETEARLRAETGAVRSDLQETEARLRAEIGTVRSDLQESEARSQARTAEQFRDLYKHLWIMGVGIVAVTVTLMKLL